MDNADFTALPLSEELELFVPDSCNLGLSFISNPEVSLDSDPNSMNNAVFNFDPMVSVEELDFLEAQLDFTVNGNASQVDFLENEHMGFDGFFIPQDPIQKLHVEGQPKSNAQMHKIKVSGEGKDLEVPTVSIELIQNKRPFKCSQFGCDKTFKNSQTLRIHHRTHFTGESLLSRQLADNPVSQVLKAGQNKKIPCRCPICGRTFVGLYELRRHFGRKHSEGEKLHNCKKCGKKFYVEVDLRDHEKLCGERVGCKCGLKFAFKCNLSAHKRTHPECAEDSAKVLSSNNSSKSSTSNGSIGVKLENILGLGSCRAWPSMATNGIVKN